MYSLFTTYIDDTRTVSHSKKSCRDTSLQVAAVVNYFGQQDVSLKQRAHVKRPGAWAGAM